MSVMTDAAADRALKARHRALWALGDYTAVATEIIPSLGRVLVDACRHRAGPARARRRSRVRQRGHPGRAGWCAGWSPAT